MNIHNPLKRLCQPLLLQVNFKDPYWAIPAGAARGWLLLAVCADLLAQWLVGKPSMLTVALSCSTMVLGWTLPSRLVGAIAGLYVTQAAVSVAIVKLVSLSGSPLLTSACTVIWSVWCFLMLAQLVLLYIRTPKALMA